MSQLYMNPSTSNKPSACNAVADLYSELFQDDEVPMIVGFFSTAWRGATASIMGLMLCTASSHSADLELAADPVMLQVGQGPRCLAAGDLNRDGRIDLVACNGLAPFGISVLTNLGNGRFAAKVDYPTDSEPYEVALGDVNGDGWPDVAVACLPVGILDVYLNDGKGGLGSRATYQIDNGCQSLVLADLNGDKHLDVIAGIFAGATILLGKGDGTFPTKIEQNAGSGINCVAVGDVTGDGVPDLLADGTRLLKGHGDGRFDKEQVVGPRSRHIALADLTGDKKVDLVSIGRRADGKIALATLINQGQGTFTQVSDHHIGNMMTTPTIVDLDGDGLLDVVTSSVHEGLIVVCLGQPGGRVAPPLAYPTGKAPNHQVVADLDGDGKPEIASVGFKTHAVTILRRAAVPLPLAPVVAAEPVSDRILRVTWTGPKELGCLSQKAIYEVEIAGNQKSPQAWERVKHPSRPVVLEQKELLDIPGLAPGGTYPLRMRTIDGLGRPGPWSQPVTATLPVHDRTPPAAVTDLKIRGRDISFVVLQWTAPGDDGAIGQATAYDLRSSTSPITEETFSAATSIPTRAPGIAGTIEVITVTKLPPGQGQFFAVRARDEAGNWSSLTKPVETKTKSQDLVPPDPVRNLRVTASTADSVTLGWMASGNDGMLGQASGYIVRYATSPITDDASFMAATAVKGVPVPQMAGGNEELVMNGLVPGTRYHVAIRAVDEAGNASSLSPGFSFEAGAGAADAGRPSGFTWILVIIGAAVGLVAIYLIQRWVLQPVDGSRTPPDGRT